MSQEDEHWMLDYARIHGIARNHLESESWANLGHVDDFLGPLEDLADLFPITEFDGDLPAEKPSFSKDAIHLLSSVTNTAQGSEMVDCAGFDPHRVRRMKQDMPVIRTDHELDMMEFATHIVPDLEKHFIPLVLVDEEADEGFTWPSSYTNLPMDFAKRSESETLAVSSEAMIHLQDTLRLARDKRISEFRDDEVLSYKKNTAREPVTPPLLPLSPPFLPVMPSIDIGDLELPDCYSSPTNQQILEVEKLLSAKDAIVPRKRERERSLEDSDPVSFDIDRVGNFYSPLRGIQDPPSSPPLKRERLQDRKVEEPLTPPLLERCLPEAKKISVNEAFLEIIPELPSIISKNEDLSSDDVDVFCDKMIAPIGINAERRMEQEQLQAADTEQRVPVPIMDFSRPLPPWKVSNHISSVASSKSPHRNFLSELKKAHLSKHIWPAIGKSERELRWSPFLAPMEDIETQEIFADNESTAEFLEQPEGIDSETLTWKPAGLRILDQHPESEDEELEVAQFPDANDMNSLIRRRKLQMMKDNEEDSDTTTRHFSAKKRMLETIPDAIHNGARPSLNRTAAYPQCDSEEPKDLILDSFSALNALEAFICMRNGGSQKPALTAEKYFADRYPKATYGTVSQQEPAASKTQESWVKTPPFPAPQFIVPSTPHAYVVSTSFMCNRKLARRVRHLYPAAKFIERDFNLHSPAPIMQDSGAQKDSPMKRGMGLEKQCLLVETTIADEADMILSPSTGLIWTTLQKIKQRSLPGQTARSTVRDKIIRAAPRYERLIILISRGSSSNIGEPPEDAATEASPEDLITDSDCEALTEFIGVCTTLHEDAQALFVPGGDEQLAQWIVAMMVKHRGTDLEEIGLLHDETLWEIFLRRAGLNAFAAQAILSELKAPDSDHVEFNFGLTAFIKMPLKERLARFEGLLGGRGVLVRVSESLDAPWP